MIHIEDTWNTSDGLKIFCQGWRPETEVRAVICVVHGIGEHSGRYQAHAEKFCPAGLALLTFDNRGHGKSEGKRGHTPGYDAYMENITNLLNYSGSKFPDAPIILFGHSMGGNLIMNYMLRYKPNIKAAIVTSPWLILQKPPKKRLLLLAKIANVFYPSLQLSNGLKSSDLSNQKKEVEKHDKDLLVHKKISIRTFLEVDKAAVWAMRHAKELSLPMLLIHGQSDKITAPEASRRFADEAGTICSFKLWPEGMHELHNDTCKEEFFDFITAWILAQI